MHFIEHIIEPTKLFLAWQSLDENHRTRYIVAELKQANEQINLNYLVDTPDFNKAKTRGFEAIGFGLCALLLIVRWRTLYLNASSSSAVMKTFDYLPS